VPAIEARLTIQPFVSRRCGIAAWETSTMPRRLMLSCRSMCFSWASSTRDAIPTPAELTSRSRPPTRSTCSRTTRSQSSGLETSAAIAVAPSSAAAASTFSAVRDASVSSNPSSRSIRPIASPMPDDPPVISADRTCFDYFRNAQGDSNRMPNLGADTQAPPLP
jgi:hypothetical protein